MIDIPQILERLLNGKRLDLDTAYSLATALTSEGLNEAQKGALLTALRCGKESFEEIAGFAKALLDKAIKIGPFPDAMDTAGTGGDKASLFNVSTATAITLAAMGVKAAKHGNVGVTSVTGSADILKELGYNIMMTPEQAEKAFKESGFVFLFAPIYHPAMKNVASVRKSLKIRTIFNLVGPLSNPARPRYQMVGVSEPWMLEPIAKALQLLGIERAAVIHGRPRIDEVSPVSTTDVYIVTPDEIVYTTVDVKDFGAEPLRSLDPLRVKSVEESKKKFIRALRGEEPEATFLALNTALAMHVKEMYDISESYKEVIEVLKSGAVIEKLKEAIIASGGQPKF